MIRKLNQISSDAHDFLEAGLCVIPLRMDGSKAATIPWKEYQERLPTHAEIDSWFSKPAGVAVVCGAVSGGLEVLDFDIDSAEIYPQWSSMVDPILCRLPVVETPSCKPDSPDDPPSRKRAGFHVYYRAPAVCGRQIIAGTKDGKVLIETRGHKCLVTTVLSPPSVHELDYEYVQVAGPVLPEVPTITADERDQLWAAALTFDQSKVLEKAQATIVSYSRPINKTTGSGRNRIERAAKYIAKMDPAISGSGGHNQLFKVACILKNKFGLSDDNAMLLIQQFNERCEPQWTDKELTHKLRTVK